MVIEKAHVRARDPQCDTGGKWWHESLDDKVIVPGRVVFH